MYSAILGSVILRILDLLEIKAFAMTSFLIGYLTQSALLMLMVTCFFMNIHTALISLGVSEGLLWILLRKKLGARSMNNSRELFFIFALAIIVTASVSKYALIPKDLGLSGVLGIWSDYFLHGITIASLGGINAYGGSFELVGTSLPLYHYIGFMLPAAVMSLQNMSGLAAATSVMLPVSTLIFVFGVYILCAQMSNFSLGFVLTIISVFVPASFVFIQSGWFDPYWLTFITPGSGIALGGCLLVVLLLMIFEESGKQTSLVLILLLCALVGLTRIHYSLLIIPVCTWTVFSYIRKYTAVNWLKINLILFALLIFILPFLIMVDADFMRYSKGVEYIRNSYAQLNFYRFTIPASTQSYVGNFFNVPTILLAVTGLYFPLYFLFLFVRFKHNKINHIDAVPLVFLIFFIILMMFSPVASNGDITEYKHRAFPLVAIIFAIFSNYYLISFIADPILRNIKYIVFFLIGLSMFFGLIANPAAPNINLMSWAKDFHGVTLKVGLLDSAKYIQEHSIAGDILATDVESIGVKLDAFATELISLSGVPAYIARPYINRSECISRLVEDRIEVLNSISAANNWNEAKEILNANHIRWFITSHLPKWGGGRSPDFFSNDVFVFDAGHSDFRFHKEDSCQ